MLACQTVLHLLIVVRFHSLVHISRLKQPWDLKQELNMFADTFASVVPAFLKAAQALEHSIQHDSAGSAAPTLQQVIQC